MSEDTLNVDSEQELSTGQELVETDESASQETTDKSKESAPKGVEKALRDTEAALKERQAEFTRLSQQMAELRGNMDMFTKLQQQAQPKPEEKDWIEDLDAEKVVEDPLSAMKQVTINLRKEFAQVMRDRDAYWQSRVEAIGGNRIDPEIKSVVDKLKDDPDLSDLPESKLVAMARKMVTPSKAVKEPRGNIAGGGKTSVAPQRKDGLTAEQVAWLKASGAMNGNSRSDTLE